MVRKNYKKIEKPRKNRCESADSGVDTTLNNRAFRQERSPYTEFNGTDDVCISLPVHILRTRALDNFLRSLSITLPENPPQSTNLVSGFCQCRENCNSVSRHAVKVVDLEEEHLDFEPDGELTDSSMNHSMFSQSTVKIVDSDNRDVNDTLDDDSISTVSIQSDGHRKDMFPVPRLDAKDGRQNMYFPFVYPNSSRTLLDSSSDESCSSELDDNLNTETEDDFSRSQNLDDSGDYDNTEQYSDCNISQEEEDRLLDSSGEASGEDTGSSELSLDRKQVAVCQFGNVRITLPTFNNNFPEEKYKEKDLKRTKPTSRFHFNEREKKKRKWDLHYKPEVTPVQVFLDDIGYIPVFDDSNNSDMEGSKPAAQSKNLYIICNENDKFVCEKSANEMQREISFGKSDDGNFKLPLPPVKRPPTRPKRTVSNSNLSNSNLQIQVDNKSPEVRAEPSRVYAPIKSSFNHSKEDDTISLIASTIGDNNEDSMDDFASTESSFTSRESPEKGGLPAVNDNYSNNMVENWIRSVPNAESPETVTSRVNTATGPLFFEGITLLPSENPKGPPMVHFRDVPQIFWGLCYYHYFKGNCFKDNACPVNHYVDRSKYTVKFKGSSPDQLRKGYWLALKYDKLFKEVYPCFLGAFGSLKMYGELIKSIKDLLQFKHINAVEALEHVINAFVDSGVTFLDTIERISFNVGFLQYPVLADILLEIIARKPNISENWEVISRIAKARGHMSPDIARSILMKATSGYPVNKNLCLDIYNVLVKNNMTDLSQISVDLLAPFRAIVGFSELEEAPPAPTPPAIVRIPNVSSTLAEHIENNLVKERERFERQATGRTLGYSPPQLAPFAPESNCYFRSYDYRTGKSYDGFGQSLDADDRYFMPGARREKPATTVSDGRTPGGDRRSTSSGSSYEGITSPASSLHFQPPPEVSEYVPATVRRVEVRVDTPSSTNFSAAIDEESVDRPLTPNLKITLIPDMPIFGKPRYRKDFKFDVSLHNLLPDFAEDVNIDERDVAQLNYAVKSKNGGEFVRLLEYYRAPATIRNFITMTIAHLKSSKAGPYEPLVNLIDALEMEKPDFAADLHIKVIFEVIIMNVLFELERRGQWDNARKLLERFCDWDSLISSQIFPIRKLTHMGRYLFLAKIFANAKNYHFTSEILQCPSLHLLEAVENWPYLYDSQVDMKTRNTVLTDFFHKGYQHNIADVANMYRRIYKHSAIYGYDACPHFNPMLISIINLNQVSLLRHFHQDIDVYAKVMDKHVLRAYTILLADQLSQEDLFKLYEMCCDKQIYTYYTGAETEIILRTNMMDKELELILGYYMHKMGRVGRPPIYGLRITIKMFESNPLYPKMLHMCVRSVQAINKKVKKILEDFSICVKDTPISKATVVEVDVELLRNWVLCSQRRFFPFGAC